jgi:hypothetical protein
LDCSQDFANTKNRIEDYLPALRDNVIAGLANAEKYKDENRKSQIESLNKTVKQKCSELGMEYLEV